MKYQCYYTENGKRCPSEQEDYWCSKIHRLDWQQDAYGIKTREDKKRLTVEEMQAVINLILKLRGHR